MKFSVELNDSHKAYAAFEWSVVDDFRLEQDGASFVTMRFKAVRPERLTRYDYRWTFDDGTVETGETGKLSWDVRPDGEGAGRPG